MSGERVLYQGYALQPVDKKGRLAIPACLREALLENSDERVLMIADEADLPCMVAYDKGWSAALKAQVAEDQKIARDLHGKGPARAADRLKNFGNVDSVAFDDAGRFILPDFVAFDLGLTDYAFFTGGDEVFHIWNPRRLIADPNVPEGTHKRCLFEMNKKGAAL
ncbi:division/cell wall cluster transcriptional repressor MraZ [Sphingomonas sp. SUN039]|uniref:division/cell wall cluster transcriptional repressor MraZ n=1 Tax=Sphingomonas sp. SUN039 TaxID=2937787 RepID=UPI002164C69A|nr:division/cell wall cluster transcriptional repressor MraZ [Sphingomonas sp. SUN039]UVO54480.1 division/cell wall cluster transcriptional repressor MraZ [Sphingomonas sp. SUN039]